MFISLDRVAIVPITDFNPIATELDFVAQRRRRARDEGVVGLRFYRTRRAGGGPLAQDNRPAGQVLVCGSVGLKTFVPRERRLA